jgi:hypothetical protein
MKALSVEEKHTQLVKALSVKEKDVKLNTHTCVKTHITPQQKAACNLAY